MKITTIVISIVWLILGGYSLSAQPINQYIQDVVQPSPNQASLGKYQDIPVSHYTGVPQIGIPLYTVTQGQLSHPISLSYHAGGIKAEELASRVGLGWNLNAGGSVSRVVQGYRDDDILARKGYYHFGSQLTSLSNQERSDVANGVRDGEPDLFSFNCGGYSGRFYFNANKEAVLVPVQDIEISPVVSGSTNNFDGFVITTPEGNTHYFGIYSGSTAYDVQHPGGGISYRSTWHLLRTETYDGLHHVSFGYEADNYSYTSAASCRDVSVWCVNNGQSGANSGISCSSSAEFIFSATQRFAFTTTNVAGKRLSSITSDDETITFTSTSDRQDLGDCTVATTNKKTLNEIEIETGAFCKKYVLSYDFFEDTGHQSVPAAVPATKRLKLTSVQERSCNGTVTNIPAYTFTYDESTTLQWRHTKQIDHWGYYNGKLNNDNNKVNIPPTTVGGLMTGSSDRSTSETHMKVASLTSLTYPTGGTTSFVYEANRHTVDDLGQSLVYDTTNCITPTPMCCGPIGDPFTVIDTQSFSAQDLSDVHLTLWLSILTQGGFCGYNSSNATIHLTITRISNGQVAFAQGFSIDPTNPPFEDEYTYESTAFMHQLVANVDYQFRLEVANGWGEVSLFNSEPMRKDTLVGGLRIKQITQHDGMDDSRDIVNSYTYLDTDGESSGLVLYQPVYGKSLTGFEFPMTNGAPVTTQVNIFSTSSFVPMSAYENNHIGYQRVIDSLHGNGKTIYTYSAIVPSFTDPNLYPVPPLPLTVVNGQEQTRALFSEGASSPLSDYDVDRSPSLFASSSIGRLMRTSEQFTCSVSGSNGFVFLVEYDIPTEVYLQGRTEFTLDGVTTTTEQTYDNGAGYIAPVHQSIINSDGAKYHTEYTYPEDLASGTNVYQQMVDRNIITPVITTHREGASLSNADTTDRYKTTYAMWNTNNGSHPYPFQYFRDEVTWNSAGTSTKLEDVVQASVNSYDGATGYPSSIMIDGWSVMSYDWNTNGTMAKKNFLDYESKYTYHTNTKLLDSVINIDQTSLSYDYDQLQRLKTMDDHCRGVTTTLDYLYGDPVIGGNYIRSTTDYPMVTHSALDILRSRQYFDGLGRPIQLIKEDQGPTNSSDIILATEYDDRGRVLHEYEAEAMNNNNGLYQPYDRLSHVKRLVRGYEPSPLNRLMTTTHTGFDHPATIVYGTNTVTIHGIDAGELAKTTRIDGDSKQTITYTDKKGRTVATLQAGPNGATPLTTLMTYDDKDRVIKIQPPGSTASSAILNFDYTYYGNDLIRFKKLPDQDQIEYRYNRRDLPTAYQDGFLSNRTNTPWIVTQYDLYGRPTKTGFGSARPNNSIADPNILIGDRLSQTDYYTTGDHIDKVQEHTSWTLRPDEVLISSENITTQYTYDGCGRPGTILATHLLNSTITEALGHRYYYDGADNMVRDSGYQQAYSIPHLIDVVRSIDFAGRPLQTDHAFDNLSQQTLSRMTYNQRNQIATHQLGQNGGGYLQTCDYSYLDNGFLSAINGSMVGTDLFGLELNYDQITTGSAGELQNNGNIAEVISKIKGRDDLLQAFRYDAYNRLSNSYSYDAAGATLSNANDYQTTYGYDVRGNLSSTTRRGRYPNGSFYTDDLIDDLDISIMPGSNQIQKVEDNAPQNVQRYGAQGSSATFMYDNIGVNKGNGTLTYDPTIGATIDYNHLNLPRRVTFDADKGGGIIEFTYDAEGNQLRKVVQQGSSILEDRYYIDGLEYKDGALVQIMHDEGRIARAEPCDQNQFLSGIHDDTRTFFGDNIISTSAVVPTGTTTFKADQSIVMNTDFTVESNKVYEAFIEPCTPGDWQYEYVLKDHLGNTRVVFKEDGPDSGSDPDILQEAHYYPFGMTLSGVWDDTEKQDYSYKYNHKETHQDFNWNWSSYGARCYMGALNRFPTPDRFCEKYPHQSPYAYAANDPIRFIDVNGDSIRVNGVIYNPGDTYEGDDAFVSSVFTALNYILDNGADQNGVIQDVASSETVIDIKENDDSNSPRRSYFEPGIDAANRKFEEPHIVFDPSAGIEFSEYSNMIAQWLMGDEGSRSPAEILLHELGHAQSFLDDSKQHITDSQRPQAGYSNREEFDVIWQIENRAAAKLGGVPRRHHRGRYIKVNSPTSNKKIKK